MLEPGLAVAKVDRDLVDTVDVNDDELLQLPVGARLPVWMTKLMTKIQ